MFVQISKNTASLAAQRISWVGHLTLILTLSIICLTAHATRDMTNIAVASASTTTSESASAELLGSQALEKLVAPIALYPDDLIAIVLPASTDPVGVVLAARRLEGEQPQSQHSQNTQPVDSAQLSASQAIDALRHYPDVLAKMNADLNWTRALGEAASSQQSDLLDAIQVYRKAAADSGFLNNDEHQVVEVAENTVMIRPRDPQVIYVPDYSPRQVVVYRTAPRRAMRYHSTPSPVYYRRYDTSHRYHRATQDWHGPTFTLSWRDRHVQRHDRRRSNNRHHRLDQHHYQHRYQHNNRHHRNKAYRNRPHRSSNNRHQDNRHQDNRHQDNRQRGYIDHRARNQYSTHNDRRQRSAGTGVNHTPRSNRGVNHRNNEQRLHNRNQTGSQRGHQSGNQQRPNKGGQQQRINNGDRNRTGAPSSNESKHLRAWK